MPHLRAFLNAVPGFARPNPKPGARLDPAAFLAHAVRLAKVAHAPPGLWLSLLVAGKPPLLPSGGPAEIVACDGDFARSLARARAPFVAHFDAAGRLAPHALDRIAAALAAHPQAQALYADAIATDATGRPAEALLKPAFDPVLLETVDYLGPLLVYRRDRAAELSESGLRAAPSGTVLHLPYPASIGPARPRALAPPPRVPGPWPKVSVVIPSRDAPALIAAVLEGLFERTDYPDFDVTIIDNGTTDPQTLALYQAHASPRLRIEIEPAPFNFSAAVNRGAALTDAPLILLLNNDIEMIEPGWLKEMVACMDDPQTAIVGAKLLYPDRTLQHAGVIAGLGGYAGHWHVGCPEDEPGPLGRLRHRQSLSVVTGACMLISRVCFAALGGFDEAAFPVAFNDVDFCLRAGARGWRVVWTPHARLIHHESLSRGSDALEQNRARHALERAALQARWRTDTLEDRAYNPWAARTHSDPWPAARASLPAPRL